MIKDVRDELGIRYKVLVLEFAQIYGNVSKAYRKFEVPKSTFYVRKQAFDTEGRAVVY